APRAEGSTGRPAGCRVHWRAASRGDSALVAYGHRTESAGLPRRLPAGGHRKPRPRFEDGV
ncbi:MAG: hypothetical protein AVDCRST_MAG49-411, partial [uncultured Thermomicrobiales bacterium]